MVAFIQDEVYVAGEGALLLVVEEHYVAKRYAHLQVVAVSVGGESLHLRQGVERRERVESVLHAEHLERVSLEHGVEHVGSALLAHDVYVVGCYAEAYGLTYCKVFVVLHEELVAAVAFGKHLVKSATP